MITPFTYSEGNILVKLLIAHCISDFLLQSSKGIKSKQTKIFRSASLYTHIVITGLLVWFLLWDINQWKTAAIIAITHLLIDAGKLYANKKINENQFAQKEMWLFLIDQLLHIIVIVWLWLWIINGYQRMEMIAHALQAEYKWLVRLLGYLIIIGPVTYVIRLLTKRWSVNLDTSEGLQDAGKWIGILERILILTLVLINQFIAIGFLIAAKSILRLIDKPEFASPPLTGSQKPLFNSRKHTEYVLIGTFLSFGFAILTGLVINRLIRV